MCLMVVALYVCVCEFGRASVVLIGVCSKYQHFANQSVVETFCLLEFSTFKTGIPSGPPTGLCTPAASWVKKKVNGRKLQFSDRHLQISDNFAHSSPKMGALARRFPECS